MSKKREIEKKDFKEFMQEMERVMSDIKKYIEINDCDTGDQELLKIAQADYEMLSKDFEGGEKLINAENVSGEEYHKEMINIYESAKLTAYPEVKRILERYYKEDRSGE